MCLLACGLCYELIFELASAALPQRCVWGWGGGARGQLAVGGHARCGCHSGRGHAPRACLLAVQMPVVDGEPCGDVNITTTAECVLTSPCGAERLMERFGATPWMAQPPGGWGPEGAWACVGSMGLVCVCVCLCVCSGWRALARVVDVPRLPLFPPPPAPSRPPLAPHSLHSLVD